MPYTEKTVLFRGLDFDSGRNPNHSPGGVAGTGSITPTNSESNCLGNQGYWSGCTKIILQANIEW